MRQERFESFLWVQILLVALLGATLGLFLSYSSLRTPYALPELHLFLATAFMLISGLIAALSATRFAVEGRRFDFVLCGGFLIISFSWLVFTVVPIVSGGVESAAATAGRTAGWLLIAAAPFVRGRTRERSLAALWPLVAALGALLLPIWLIARGPAGASPSTTLAFQALLQLVAAVGFGARYRRRGEDLDRWLSFFATLTLFASLGLEFSPSAVPSEVARGDFVALVAHALLLFALWRAVRAAEFGRAVAEERARVARDVHDGLAQYLFAISTNALMLEAGVDPAVALPRLKEAALAAQREARYAILALSSAAGQAPFDTALRRFVELLTADGALEVEVEIDPTVRLGPDEQIEVLRIVQEGLANARRHAGAAHAWVQIGGRADGRFVTVRDDGEGFEPDTVDGGQGLRNMRERAASIGGAFSVRSAPGRGTSLEVVLRT
jgi:signal transduction histidine kinase